jgi:hypothetical protein
LDLECNNKKADPFFFGRFTVQHSNMLRNFSLLLFALFLSLNAYSQIGGTYTYAFLNLPNAARAASLGGKIVAIPDDDLNLPFHNPALLSDEMDSHLVLNYVNYFADVNYGYASYAKSYKNLGRFAAGIHYINYGKFTAADEFGTKTGTFNASEYALNLIYSKTIDSVFHLGLNLKPIYSIFESYNSFGLAADIGLTYHKPNDFFMAGIVIKNIGTQIVSYYDGNREPLPFEIQAGISQRLQYAPFRFSLLLQHLQKFDLTYNSPLDPNDPIDPFTGSPVKENKLELLGDKLMRHLILGVEFIPGENFYVNLGYNYLRRQELKVPARHGMTGFSWGFGLKISKFHISYGRASYHLAGGSNHFSLSTDLSQFYKRIN